MWEPFHVGLEPELLHLDIICSLAVTQEISQLPKILGLGLILNHRSNTRPNVYGFSTQESVEKMHRGNLDLDMMSKLRHKV
jgi:hypothetical protein